MFVSWFQEYLNMEIFSTKNERGYNYNYNYYCYSYVVFSFITLLLLLKLLIRLWISNFPFVFLAVSLYFHSHLQSHQSLLNNIPFSICVCDCCTYISCASNSSLCGFLSLGRRIFLCRCSNPSVFWGNLGFYGFRSMDWSGMEAGSEE